MYELVVTTFTRNLFGTTVQQEMDAPSLFWVDTGENIFISLGTCPGVYKLRAKVISNAC